MEDPLTMNHVPTYGIIQRLKSAYVCIFWLIFTGSLLVLSVTISINCRTADVGGVDLSSVLIYFHGLFWAISLIFDQYIQYELLRLRRRGYFESYSNFRNLSQLPFWITSGWSCLLMMVNAYLYNHCATEEVCSDEINLTRTQYIGLCMGIEMMILAVLLLYFCEKLFKFNRRKPYPDVFDEDYFDSVVQYGSLSQFSYEELFQRQADMIRHYRESQELLKAKVLELHLVHDRQRTPQNSQDVANNTDGIL